MFIMNYLANKILVLFPLMNLQYEREKSISTYVSTELSEIILQYGLFNQFSKNQYMYACLNLFEMHYNQNS